LRNTEVTVTGSEDYSIFSFSTTKHIWKAVVCPNEFVWFPNCQKCEHNHKSIQMSSALNRRIPCRLEIVQICLLSTEINVVSSFGWPRTGNNDDHEINNLLKETNNECHNKMQIKAKNYVQYTLDWLQTIWHHELLGSDEKNATNSH